MTESLSYGGIAACAFCAGIIALTLLAFWMRHFKYESSGMYDIDIAADNLAERLWGDD